MGRKADTAIRIAARDMKFTLTQGEKRFSPVEYNSFSVGPFSVEVTVHKGENIDEVLAEANALLIDQARQSYQRNLDSYCRGLSYNDKAVRAFMEKNNGS